MKIAVVGAGLFGSLAAIKLAENGHRVHLFERNSQLLSEASGMNQYRLHRGYHYPRSTETALQSKNAETSFLEEFGKCMLSNSIPHYYAIPSKGSLLSPYEYEEFLDRVELPYVDVTSNSHPRLLLNMDAIHKVYQVRENTIDILEIRKTIFQRLIDAKVNVHLQTWWQPESEGEFDIIINATYASYNKILPEEFRQDFQFEFCEKPIIEPPKDLRNVSIVLIDGEFGCIDPLSKYNAVIGHVREAIHYSNTGQLSQTEIWPEENRKSNSKAMLSELNKYITGIEQSKVIESMYVWRAVLPNREYDDARPSYIQKHNDKYYSIFSGKLGTAVDIANQLSKMI